MERALIRKPLMLNKAAARTIARYIIEPNYKTTISYNELMEESFHKTMQKLGGLISDYRLFDEVAEKSVKERIANKVLGKEGLIADKLKREGDTIALDEVGKRVSEVGIEITKQEEDYLALWLYKRDHTVKSLYRHLLELGELASGYKKQSAKVEQALSKKLAEVSQQEDKSINDEVKDFKMEEKSFTPTKESPEKHPDITNEGIIIDEDKAIEIAQKVFVKISKKVLIKGISLPDFFASKLINRPDAILLATEELIGGLQDLGINNLEPIECSCLVKILAAGEDERFIKFDYLMEILSEYGIDLKMPPLANKESVGIERLDKVSMIILLALSEYLEKTSLTLEETFEGKLQDITVSNSKSTQKVINTRDMFSFLEEIGVAIEGKRHEGLEAFLCVAQEHKDKLSLKKIEKVINEFNSNENIRNKALRYYEEMVRDMGYGDEIDFEEEIARNNQLLSKNKNLMEEFVWLFDKRRTQS
eukprot:TRINITY_DN10812_c0_g3_i1.p1 TRINITY_DN10812_c0_g3~~TRINITY_DN10812_c0_g3_i1.p1  ORF type:complete len:477 (+),score=98.04 TRINITY_DN10812_c0_g3_i1:1054-2484(+)